MTEMQPENVGQRLKDYLLSNGVLCNAGVSEDRLEQFEVRYKVRLPGDIRNYFLTMSVSPGAYGYGMIRFWSLEEIKSVEEIIRATPPDGSVIKRSYSEI